MLPHEILASAIAGEKKLKSHARAKNIKYQL